MNISSAPEEMPMRSVARRSAFGDHLRTLPSSFYWCLLALSVYLLVMRLTIGWRGEQFLGTALMLFAFFWNEDTRRVGGAIVPLLITVVVYDLTHLTEPLVQQLHLHVHFTEAYNFDKSLFGIHTAEGVLTPNEFFAAHHWAWVDFATGCSYILFLYLSLAFPIVLALRRGRPDLVRLATGFGWALLAVNVIGYTTYYLYPSAPPWYVAAHGFGPPDFTVSASPSAAIRWDQLTGLHYFERFYSRSADVFGAIPSLHVADPLLIYLYGRHLHVRWFNALSLGFYLLVCFAAIYLQHHFMLDVMLGSGLAAGGYLVQWGLFGDRATLRAAPRPAG